MALTTGWFTYSTPQDTANIRGKNGKALRVLRFGPGWMGCAVADNGGRKKHLRKVEQKDVADPRAALRMPARSAKPVGR